MSEATDKFDSWLKGMKSAGMDENVHYHPLLQIAVEMRAERASILDELKGVDPRECSAKVWDRVCNALDKL